MTSYVGFTEEQFMALDDFLTELAEGGGGTLIEKSITANGTYSAEDDNADGYSEVTVNVSSGGGASNVVTGTFTTESSTAIMTIDVPYTGSGYPTYVSVYVHGGLSNSSNTGWYNVADRYKAGIWTALKTDTTAPSDRALFNTYALYKDNATTWNSYGSSVSSNYTYRVGKNPATGYMQQLVIMDGSTTLKVAVASSSTYGFAADTEYDYVIVYSE